MRAEWDMSFAVGPREALALFEKEPFDVVISDMRMPEMTGAELLSRIRDANPAVARIVLSGHSHMESAVRSAGIAHQYLAKPCDAETLRKTITRVLALRSLLRDEKLKQLVAGIGMLPSLPTSYAKINQELTGEDPSLQRVSEIIAQDIAMSAKVLQLVNSAFFGLARRVQTIEQAVTLLGTDIIKSLVLSNAAFSQFQPKSSRFSAEQLWSHSLLVGAVAAAITKAQRAERTVIGEALQAGILHDLGQLILATHLPVAFDTALEQAGAQNVPLIAVETNALGSTHAQVGAYLLGLWGLPDSTVEAVAFHHNPKLITPTSFAPLTAVHAADALIHAAVDGPDCPESRIDLEHITAVCGEDALATWRDIADDILNGSKSS
jgi:HD-like signal output (HDOD) protein